MNLYPIPDFTAAVHAEWIRARGLFPGQEETLSLHEWYAIVGEEIGEIARDLNAPTDGKPLDLEHLREEIIQSAAMLGRMFSTLERLRRARPDGVSTYHRR